jgi:hypothetical protein
MSNLDQTLNKKRRIACRFRIEQRIQDPKSYTSYLNIMTDIANLFQTKVTIVERQNSYFHITASSRISLELILNYFNMYPLKSSKYLDYNNWLKSVNLLLADKH